MTVANPDEIQGINSRIELAAVSRIVRQAKNAELMAAGVTIEDPATTYIDRDVTVGTDTIIHPACRSKARRRSASSCEIHSGVRIVDSQIGDRVDRAQPLRDQRIADRRRRERRTVHPPSPGRRRSVRRAKVGNFVEMKKTMLGAGSKAMHLDVPRRRRRSARTSTSAPARSPATTTAPNKQTTTIEDGAFIGSDTQLIAPVTVGKDAYVGTGTTVREDVPPGALAVSAGKQRNIEGWVEKRKEEAQVRRGVNERREI